MFGAEIVELAKVSVPSGFDNLGRTSFGVTQLPDVISTRRRAVRQLLTIIGGLMLRTTVFFGSSIPIPIGIDRPFLSFIRLL